MVETRRRREGDRRSHGEGEETSRREEEGVDMTQTSRDTRAELASSLDKEWAQRLKCL